MLDLDAAIDIDDPLFDLDGLPVGAPPVQPHAGTGGRASPYRVPTIVIGRAAAELGPVTSSAVLIRTLDVRAQEALLLLFL